MPKNPGREPRVRTALIARFVLVPLVLLEILAAFGTAGALFFAAYGIDASPPATEALLLKGCSAIFALLGVLFVISGAGVLLGGKTAAFVGGQCALALTYVVLVVGSAHVDPSGVGSSPVFGGSWLALYVGGPMMLAGVALLARGASDPPGSNTEPAR